MSQVLKRLTYVSDDRGIAVRIPAETRDFSLLRSVLTDTGLDAVRHDGSLPGAEWPVRETNHSPPHNAEVNEWRYTSLLLYSPLWHVQGLFYVLLDVTLGSVLPWCSIWLSGIAVPTVSP